MNIIIDPTGDKQDDDGERACRCRVVGGTHDAEWEQVDDCPIHATDFHPKIVYGAMVNALVSHAWNDYKGHCDCGWFVPSEVVETEIDRVFAMHQADYVIGAWDAVERDAVAKWVVGQLAGGDERWPASSADRPDGDA